MSLLTRVCAVMYASLSGVLFLPPMVIGGLTSGTIWVTSVSCPPSPGRLVLSVAAKSDNPGTNQVAPPLMCCLLNPYLEANSAVRVSMISAGHSLSLAG